MAITIAPPAQGGGFQKQDHEGHLLLFVGIEKLAGPTQFGDATWAQVQWVADLDDDSVATDVAIHGKALAPAVYGPDAPVVLGRLVKGTSAREGQSPPWLLDAPNDADLKAAQVWIDAYVTELPSGKLIVDTDAVGTANEPSF